MSDVHDLTEAEEREEWERITAEANAYVEEETAKFIERMRSEVTERWGART